MRRPILLACLLGALVAAPAFATTAQSMNQWSSFARGQVQQIWQELKREFGFGYLGDMVVGALEQGDDEYFEVEFLAHREYVIVGLCDDDCSDLDILVYDWDDNVVLSDMETDDAPVVRVPTGNGGTYYVEAAMPGCSVEPCYYAVQIFQRYPGS